MTGVLINRGNLGQTLMQGQCHMNMEKVVGKPQGTPRTEPFLRPFGRNQPRQHLLWTPGLQNWWWWWFSRSIVADSFNPWAVTCQAPLSMGFSRQQYWSGLSFLPPEDFPIPGIEPESLSSPTLAGGFFTTCDTWEEPKKMYTGSSNHDDGRVRCKLSMFTFSTGSKFPKNP